ncbi:hypothetical protein B0H19DRAFT_1367957 [Mycena capillaripes]|nr:hypothetical protein B0H19DRAFT_1367957 [Mycena capillaripes]
MRTQNRIPDVTIESQNASKDIPRVNLCSSDFRTPFPPLTRDAHVLHARVLSWFLDAPAAPFGGYRTALAGKAAGKDVGMWFGLSVTAGALRMLVYAFPACDLRVSVAIDGTHYQTEIFTTSYLAALAPSSSSPVASVSLHGQSLSSHGSGSKKGKESTMWGDRPVLLDGVHQIYYETIKSIYQTPAYPSGVLSFTPFSLLAEIGLTQCVMDRIKNRC